MLCKGRIFEKINNRLPWRGESASDGFGVPISDGKLQRSGLIMGSLEPRNLETTDGSENLIF